MVVREDFRVKKNGREKKKIGFVVKTASGVLNICCLIKCSIVISFNLHKHNNLIVIHLLLELVIFVRNVEFD